MRESKAELMDRLRREGRWEAFVRRREELKASGTSAGDAWRMAAAEFPPPAAPASADPDGTAEPPPDLSCLCGKSGVSMLEAVQWVFDHLDAPWVQPVDAPSAGAWSLRDWARRHPGNRAEFYTTFVPKMLPTRQQLEKQAEPDGDDYDEEAGLALIEKLLADPAEEEEETRRRFEANRSLARAVLADELCPACRAGAEQRGIAPAVEQGSGGAFG